MGFKLVFLMGVTVFVACSSSKLIPDSAVGCEEPRPQMCTRDYRPVCGVADNSLAKTYGNACSACADNNVNYVIEGACIGRPPKQ
jgi:Kazal-type serine protease inhibitor domain